ncbi:hypothetical protein ASPACDRAFT_31140, partial [Aspergillus aculeatus ATCC 16872]
ISKVLGTFVQKVQGFKNASSKFTSSVTESNRILPSRNKDTDFQLRIDAGYYDSTSKGLNVVLQVNSQAKSPALRDWARKNKTHTKLATATFDTAAVNKNTKFQKVLKALVAEGKSKLG